MKTFAFVQHHIPYKQFSIQQYEYHVTLWQFSQNYEKNDKTFLLETFHIYCTILSRKPLECCLSLTTKPCSANILMSKFSTSGITHCYDNQVMVCIFFTHVALRSLHIIVCLPTRLINVTVCRQCIYEYVNILGQLLYTSQEVYTPCIVTT